MNCECSRISFLAWIFRCISPQPRLASTKLSARNLCGLGHYNMKAYLEVMSQQDFDDWLKKEAAMQ